jgi:putative cofactor-binding repeat protein
MTDLTRGVRIESNIVGFGPTGLRARGGAAFVNNVILGCGVGIEASASSIEPGATPDPQVYTGNVIDGCDVGTDWNGSGDSRPTGWGIFSNGDQAATLSGNLIRGPVYHARGLAAVTFHRVQPIEDRTPTRVVDYVAIEPPPTPEYLARRDQRARLFAQSATRGRSETPERISTLAAFIAETIRGATP